MNQKIGPSSNSAAGATYLFTTVNRDESTFMLHEFSLF